MRQINNDKTTTTVNEMNHQHKRSLEDYGFSTNLKRRRHLSPQNSNIEQNSMNDSISSNNTNKKKTRTKSKNQSTSLLNTSIDSNNEYNHNNQTSRKLSSRNHHQQQQINEINLPNWERMCPNIDQILSNKHTQSGVFAHEVQLVQQELEALLSMSIVRENILKDLLKTSINHSNDTIRSKIRKHQEAERVYTTTKKIPKKKPLPPTLVNHPQQQQQKHGPHYLLDRQVAIAPIEAAKIDHIWSDINTYHYKISSNDILNIENLVKFNKNFQNKIEQLKLDYQNQLIEEKTIIEKLNTENYNELNEFTKVNSLITHYVDHTTLSSFQTKLYEHIGQTSPVYKTPISSPIHGRILGNNFDFKDPGAHLRVSPRLHSNHRLGGIFSLPNLKIDDDSESIIKSKKKSQIISSPSSTMKFQQRIENVQNYLNNQNIINNHTVKRQLFTEQKIIKKRKNSLSISIPNNNNNDLCTDKLQKKLSTLESLLHECSIISNSALKRAHLQSNNENIWLKLNTMEYEIENLIEKLNTTGGYANNSTTEKQFQNLSQLLKDWQKYEEEFDQQLEEIFQFDQ